jgi:hypothetical protein
MRKEAGLAVSDRIRLSISGGAEVATALSSYQEWIASEVLATELRQQPGIFPDSLARQDIDLEGVDVHIELSRTESHGDDK